VGKLGLKRAQTRRLEAALAWREVAGVTLSRGVRIELARGLLDVVAPTAEVQAVLETVAGEIAGRMTVRCPGLGIRRWRVRLAGEEGGRSRAVRPADPSATAKREDTPPCGGGEAVVGPDREPETRPVPDTAELVSRLRAASLRMLARQKP
jgi:hypothetical protein